MRVNNLAIAVGIGALCYIMAIIIFSSAIAVLHYYGSYDTFRDNVVTIIPIGTGVLSGCLTLVALEKK